jgi:hypothetical protein
MQQVLAVASECRILAAELASAIGPPRVESPTTKHLIELVLLAFTPKVCDTFDALALLCKAGWGVEAGTLLRVELEASANAALIASNPVPFLFLYMEDTKRGIESWLRATEYHRKQTGSLPPDMRMREEMAQRELQSITPWLCKAIGEPPPTDPYAWRQRGNKKGERRYWHQIPIEERMRVIGWSAWYDTIYRLMSAGVHAGGGTQSVYLEAQPEAATLYGPKWGWAKAVLPYAGHVLLMHFVTVDTVFGLGQRARLDVQGQRVLMVQHAGMGRGD